MASQIEDLRSTGDLRGQVNDLNSGSDFWLITPLKVTAKPKFKHHHNSMIKPLQMIPILIT